jgi:hypothetical protein
MPVAGFFKRLKDLPSKLLGGANILNKIYKTISPVADLALDFIPYGSIVKPILHGISTGVDVVNNLATNVKNRQGRDAIQDIQTIGDIGNTMYNAVNSQLPMNSGFISDIRNNARNGFQSNQQAQPRQNQNIGTIFGNPMNGVIMAQPNRQGMITDNFF